MILLWVFMPNIITYLSQQFFYSSGINRVLPISLQSYYKAIVNIYSAKYFQSGGVKYSTSFSNK